MGATPSLPALMAGLPASSACVWLGPPLLASGPSSGSTPARSLKTTKLQLPSLSRLLPNETTAPWQSAGLFSATIEFRSVVLPAV